MFFVHCDGLLSERMARDSVCPDVSDPHEEAPIKRKVPMDASGEKVSVPTGPIVYRVDTVRLLSDGADERRDLHALDFLKQAGVRNGISFVLDKPGASVSFGLDDGYFFALADGNGSNKKRTFTFISQNGGGSPDEIDTGVVLQFPDNLDVDGKLFFECRSKDHSFTWFIQCLPDPADLTQQTTSPVTPPVTAEPDTDAGGATAASY